MSALPDLAHLARQAVDLHRAGRLTEAENLYRQILAVAPGDFAASHLLGVIRYQEGRYPEALALIESALRVRPGDPAALTNHALVLMALGRWEPAVNALDRLLAIKPTAAEAWHKRGKALFALGRWAAALENIERLLAIQPDHAGALNDRGVALGELGRIEEGLASFAAALERQPDYVEAWNNHGGALRSLGRSQAALASFGKALALEPHNAMALNNRGLALWDLRRWEDALADFDAALAIAADYAQAWYNRGNVLRDLHRLGDAIASYRRALALQPHYPEALYNLGMRLCEAGSVAEGFDLLARRAALVYGQPRAEAEDLPPHRLRHDREQQAYLGGEAGPSPLAFRHEGGARVDGAAVNPAIAAQATGWRAAHPQVLVLDDLLTPEALEQLRRFCWGSTIWRRNHADGYLGAFPEHGFAAPVLTQITEELRAVLPEIFSDYPLLYAWGFKYDSALKGIAVHADFAAVNVNFWITPDEANLDPDHGGLVIWDIKAPPDWDFEAYNANPEGIAQFLSQHGARPTTIPYRANRAVIFDSDLFHQTDAISFRDGYCNRRINITLLYGRRQSAAG